MLAICRGRPPLKTIEDWYWVLSDGNTHPCPESSRQLSWFFSCEMAGRFKDGQVNWLKMAVVNDTFEKISDGAGVHGVKHYEVLKNWETWWKLKDDTRADCGKSKVKEASMWNNMHTVTGHLAPGVECPAKDVWWCVIYPQHLWIAWGFKVQSGFKTTEARRDSTNKWWSWVVPTPVNLLRFTIGRHNCSCRFSQKCCARIPIRSLSKSSLWGENPESRWFLEQRCTGCHDSYQVHPYRCPSPQPCAWIHNRLSSTLEHFSGDANEEGLI